MVAVIFELFGIQLTTEVFWSHDHNKQFDPQLFWEKKLSGLHPSDIAEELVKTMDLPKGLQGEESKRSYILL